MIKLTLSDDQVNKIKAFLESERGKLILAQAGQELMHHLDDPSPEDVRKMNEPPYIRSGLLDKMGREFKFHKRSLPYVRTRRTPPTGE